MFGIPAEQIVPIANFIGLGVLGIVAFFGQRYGRSKGGADKTVEVAGALIDAESVRQLTGAIEAQTMETIATRKDNEKARQVAYRAVEGVNKLADEIEELRRAVADVATQIARKA